MPSRTKLTLLFACLCCVIWRASGQAIVEPLNREVALAGEIKKVHGYGPPGYGEDKKTDARITYWVLDIPNAINVLCTPEKTEWASVDCKATKRLRLFFPTLPADNGLELKAKAMKEQKAVVTGILHRQDTLGQMTPIYMSVTKLQPVQPPHNR